MRTFVLCMWIFLFSAHVVTAAEYKPRWADLPCKICVERPEEQGILNVREARIIIDDRQALVLIGGQAACVFISPGNHFIYAESYNPYNPNPEEPAQSGGCRKNWDSPNQNSKNPGTPRSRNGRYWPLR